MNRIFNISAAIAALLAGVILLSSCQDAQQPMTAKSWSLVAKSSNITLFAVKADDVGEVFTISLQDGNVSDTGKVTITFAPSEIETGIPIRNSRMGKYLFEAKKWPIATITTQLDNEVIRKITAGATQTLPAEIDVYLHGISATYDILFAVTSTANGRIVVSNTKPIPVHAEDFQLSTGLDKLQELAGLSSITPVVAVSFTLVFENEQIK